VLRRERLDLDVVEVAADDDHAVADAGMIATQVRRRHGVNVVLDIDAEFFLELASSSPVGSTWRSFWRKSEFMMACTSAKPTAAASAGMYPRLASDPRQTHGRPPL
jgi:hypothetical protein